MFKHLQLTRPLAILDAETTGLAPEADRIVELAVVRFSPDGDHSSAVQRLDPGIPIPAAATAIHGISNLDVLGHPSFGDVAEPLLGYLVDCDLVGYGIKRFDLPFLQAKFGRVGLELPLEGRAVVDVLEIYHDRERRDLPSAVRRYCGREHFAVHAALADAAATADVLDQMLGCYTDLPRTPGELDQHFRVPNAVDRDGRFVRDGDQIVFTFGKYRYQPLVIIARSDPGYLWWMLSAGFSGDTLQIVHAALRQGGVADSALAPCRRPTGATPTLVGDLVTI